jgi:NADH:ubiquinone oxidoreductase subunit F (NADH-binding)/(2Fe-2S) ferredoxin
MTNCLFCHKPLEPGKVFHDSPECRKERQKVSDYIEKEDRITVGLATCGISAGALETLERLKKHTKIPIEDVGCTGMCFNEPVVTVRKDGKLSIYSNLTSDKVDELLLATEHGKRLKSNFVAEKYEDIDYFRHQTRIIMARSGMINPVDIKQYIATNGFLGLQNALEKTPAQVIQTMKDSGLRGRGGAGFSTGQKWEFLAKAQGEKYLIINADEGDPGAFMNRALLESDPFQVLEGFIIASYASGATKGIIYTRAEYPLAISTLENAIEILRKNNLVGPNILGKGFDFEISIMKGAGAFVCGEETALMRSIEGKRGHPRPRPPYPAEKGLWKKPTNINNVETYAHASNIFAKGVDFYKTLGSVNNSGTKCICLTGKIKNSGVIEIQLGIPIRKLIFDIGGGIKHNKKFKAVQSGGPSGGCIVESELDTPLDFDHIPKLGTIMGSGGLVVMDEDDCMVSIAKFFLTFTTEESCGKCVPCREGTKRMLELVDKITKGLAEENDLERLKNLALVIRDTSLCGLGQSAPNPVLSTIEKFRDEYLAHIIEKRCPTKNCTELMKYHITEKCVGCGNCQRNCPVDAISGKLKSRYSISQAKCIKCGKCYEVCAFSAIAKK